MGAVPKGAVVALSCPEHRDAEAVMAGCLATLQHYDCPLLGGDTTASAQLVITVTVWGEAAHKRFLRRDGGSPGDLLVVTGPLGGSLISGRHLKPEPRLAEGAWFAGHPAVKAAMDLSDGLGADVRRLASASSCGAMLLPAQIPVHDDVEILSDTTRAAFDDGEDYELLVAIAPEHWPSVQIAWPFERHLCVVGWLIDGDEVLMETSAGRVQHLPYHGFEHRA
jgi:thiamine-monophosphate kinase